MITENFRRKTKRLSRAFHELSREFSRIYARTLAMNIELLKKSGETPELKHSRHRVIENKNRGRFYRPGGFDMFRAEKLAARRRDALDPPFWYTMTEEWTQLQERERDWYRLKAEEHYEETMGRYGRRYLKRRSKGSRSYVLKGDDV